MKTASASPAEQLQHLERAEATVAQALHAVADRLDAAGLHVGTAAARVKCSADTLVCLISEAVSDAASHLEQALARLDALTELCEPAEPEVYMPLGVAASLGEPTLPEAVDCPACLRAHDAAGTCPCQDGGEPEATEPADEQITAAACSPEPKPEPPIYRQGDTVEVLAYDGEWMPAIYVYLTYDGLHTATNADTGASYDKLTDDQIRPVPPTSETRPGPKKAKRAQNQKPHPRPKK